MSELGPGACDCHIHVFEPRAEASNRLATTVADATVERYRGLQAALGLQRVVVVQANAYGFDNRVMLDALAAFGPDARGVAVIAPDTDDTDDAEMARLHALGVRGVRLHMLAGGALQWPQLDAVAARLRPFGWHVQVQFDGWQWPARLQQLQSLRLPVVIDHLGKFLGAGPPDIDAPAFRALQELLDSGQGWVKLSAPYESSRDAAPHYDDVSRLARSLAGSHPERCLWGSNWPHPGRQPAPRDRELLDLLREWAGDDATRQRILVDNPAALYGWGPTRRELSPSGGEVGS